MKINILTDPRSGGPFQWGQSLVRVINNSQDKIRAKHVHILPGLVISCLYQNADIIHSTIPIPFKLWRKPTVVTMLGDYTIEPNIWQMFYPKTITKANIVTTPSRLLKQKLDLKNAVVIPNAVFPEEFEPTLHISKDQLDIVTIMNFYFPNKVIGLLNIMEILSKIQKRHFRYTVIGDGTHLNIIRNLVARTGVDVHFVGFQSDPKLTLATSDIFLYYSYHDVFPTVILEAMASGLPVITNNVGATPEIINNGEDGYTVNNDDEYLDCLLALLDDYSLRREIGQNARAKVEREFNWHKTIEQFTQLYSRLL